MVLGEGGAGLVEVVGEVLRGFGRGSGRIGGRTGRAAWVNKQRN